tara:strand:+ start:305 stop:1138 length:834 start_codon:yes stop_codon:yes gene_type:complete
MKKIILLNILILIFQGCDEPNNFNCYDDTEIDDCGVCCGGSSNIECSTGPNIGAMDSCGVCFGNNTECIGCTDSDAINYDNQSTISDKSCIYDANFWNLDVGPLIEDNWCKNDDFNFNSSCNDYSSNEQDCLTNGGSPGIFICEWAGTFETKVGLPIYWLNSSTQDITIEIIETIPPTCTPINSVQDEPIVNDISECLIINNEQDCAEYDGQGVYSQNPCEWQTTAWYDFGQEVQTIHAETSNTTAQVFNGFSEPGEKIYRITIIDEIKEAKIKITE